MNEAEGLKYTCIEEIYFLLRSWRISYHLLAQSVLGPLSLNNLPQAKV